VLFRSQRKARFFIFNKAEAVGENHAGARTSLGPAFIPGATLMRTAKLNRLILA
jgi:hypothetical protein